MPFPTPEPGLVLSFSYLWRYEHDDAHNEGRKDRPCIIVSAAATSKGDLEITLVPVTHREPADPEAAIEMPQGVKQHLGLDDAFSWVIVNEVNQFKWPGYDLRHVPGSKTRYDYGLVPPHFLERIKTKILDRFTKKRMAITKRD